MKTKLFNLNEHLIFLVLCMTLVDITYADSVKVTETQSDKVKCNTTTIDGEKTTECFQETTGKFSFTAVISANTFTENNIDWNDVNTDTQLSLKIGSFSFTDTLTNAASKKLTSNALNGIWNYTHQVCTYNSKTDTDVCKDVKDTTVKITATRHKNLTISVSGTSQQDMFGQQVLSGLCQSEGTGLTTADATLSVNESDITGQLKVNCKVKESDVTAKDGNDFQLFNISASASLIQ